MLSNPEASRGASRTGEPSRVFAGSPLRSLDDFESYLEQWLRRGPLRPFDWDRSLMGELFDRFASHLPRVDVIEREQDILVQALVPGVQRQDLHISVSGNLLTINGRSRESEGTGADEQFHRREIVRREFSRSIPLPASADISECKATLQDGVLNIVIPRREDTVKRYIPVQEPAARHAMTDPDDRRRSREPDTQP